DLHSFPTRRSSDLVGRPAHRLTPDVDARGVPIISAKAPKIDRCVSGSVPIPEARNFTRLVRRPLASNDYAQGVDLFCKTMIHAGQVWKRMDCASIPNYGRIATRSGVLGAA